MSLRRLCPTNLSDDCGVRSAAVEIDFNDGRGFRRVGSLADNGRNGDRLAGDGVWTGNARVSLPAAGSYAARIAVQDRLGALAPPSPFTLTAP